MRLRFEKALAVLLLMVSMAFMPNELVAQEDTAPPDTNMENILSLPDGVEKTSDNIPRLFVSGIEGYGIRIHVKGISEEDVVDYTWNGISIGEVVKEYVTSGIIEIDTNEEGDIGFTLTIGVEDPSLLEGNPVFGIVLSSGLIISQPFELSDDAEKFVCGGICVGIIVGTVVASAGFVASSTADDNPGLTHVYGKIYTRQKSCWGRWCSWKKVEYDESKGGGFRVAIKNDFHEWVWFKNRTDWIPFRRGKYHYEVEISSYCRDVYINVMVYSDKEGKFVKKWAFSDTWACQPWDSDDRMDITVD